MRPHPTQSSGDTDLRGGLAPGVHSGRGAEHWPSTRPGAQKGLSSASLGRGSHLVAGEWAHLLVLQMVGTPEAWVGDKGAPEVQLSAGPRAQVLQGDTCTQWVTGGRPSHGSRGTQELSPGLFPTHT